MPFSPLLEIFEELQAGRMVILVDDPDRENEGDLVLAAEKASPEGINFMIRHGSGIVCLTMTNEKADSLNLPLQVTANSSGEPLEASATTGAWTIPSCSRKRGRLSTSVKA